MGLNRSFLLYQVTKCVSFSHQRNKSVSFIFQREFTVLDLPSTKVPSVPSYGNKVTKHVVQVVIFNHSGFNELRCEKTGFLHMQKQRRRSASR